MLRALCGLRWWCQQLRLRWPLFPTVPRDRLHTSLDRRYTFTHSQFGWARLGSAVVLLLLPQIWNSSELLHDANHPYGAAFNPLTNATETLTMDLWVGSLTPSFPHRRCLDVLAPPFLPSPLISGCACSPPPSLTVDIWMYVLAPFFPHR